MVSDLALQLNFPNRAMGLILTGRRLRRATLVGGAMGYGRVWRRRACAI